MNTLWIVYAVLFIIGLIFIQYIVALILTVLIIAAGFVILIKRRFWK